MGNIANMLNSEVGPNKSLKEWRKVNIYDTKNP